MIRRELAQNPAGGGEIRLRTQPAAAAVLCRGPNGMQVAAQTDAVTLSRKGDAKIKAHVNVPSCIAAVIVLRERYEGKIGGWLAATGI